MKIRWVGYQNLRVEIQRYNVARPLRRINNDAHDS